MISLWSVCSATLWFSLCACLLFALRRNNDFLSRYGVAAWTGAMLLTVVRLLFPLDIRHTVVLRSYHVLPVFHDLLNYELFPGLSLIMLLVGIWTIGALVMLVLFLGHLLWDSWRLKQALLLPPSPSIRAAAQACGLDPGIIFVSPAVSSPMTSGLIRPTIYFPVDDYPEAALSCILRHEACHIRRHDAWIKLGLFLFHCLFWWNPLVRFAQRYVEDILELRADRAALENASSEEQTAYAEAMSYVAKQTCRRSHAFTGAVSFSQPRNSDLMILRAQLALNQPHPPKWRVLAIFTLSLALFVVSYLFIWQPAGFPPGKDEGVPIHIFYQQTSYLKQTPSGDYELWSNGEYAGSFPADALNDELFQNLEVFP